jgi:hypothetical protein
MTDPHEHLISHLHVGKQGDESVRCNPAKVERIILKIKSRSERIIDFYGTTRTYHAHNGDNKSTPEVIFSLGNPPRTFEEAPRRGRGHRNGADSLGGGRGSTPEGTPWPSAPAAQLGLRRLCPRRVRLCPPPPEPAPMPPPEHATLPPSWPSAMHSEAPIEGKAWETGRHTLDRRGLGGVVRRCGHT